MPGNRVCEGKYFSSCVPENQSMVIMCNISQISKRFFYFPSSVSYNIRNMFGNYYATDDKDVSAKVIFNFSI